MWLIPATTTERLKVPYQGEQGCLPKSKMPLCDCIFSQSWLKEECSRQGASSLRASPLLALTSLNVSIWHKSARWVEDNQSFLPLRRGWEQTWLSSGCPPPSPPPQSSVPPPEARGQCLPGSPIDPSKHTHRHKGPMTGSQYGHLSIIHPAM